MSKFYRISLLIGVLVMIFESLTKGWGSLILAPLLIIVIPVLLTLGFFAARRMRAGEASKEVIILAWTMLIGVVVFYISCIGFGDTQDVLLFGFLRSNINDPLAKLSDNLFWIAGLVTIASALLLLAFLITQRKKKLTSANMVVDTGTVQTSGQSPVSPQPPAANLVLPQTKDEQAALPQPSDN